MNIVDVIRKGSSVWVHCPTFEEAKRILYMCGTHGGRWISGAKYFDRTHWHIYKERTVYVLNFKALLGPTFGSIYGDIYDVKSEKVIPSLAISDENES